MTNDILSNSVQKNYRSLLRASILEERGFFPQLNRMSLICGVCWTPVKAIEAHMHEALISRGKVMGNKEFSHLIFNRYNVVPRHDTCPEVTVDVGDIEKEVLMQITFKHEAGVGGSLVFERCARYLAKLLGRKETRNYLVGASKFLAAGTEALNRWDDICLENERVEQELSKIILAYSNKYLDVVDEL